MLTIDLAIHGKEKIRCRKKESILRLTDNLIV